MISRIHYKNIRENKASRFYIFAWFHLSIRRPIYNQSHPVSPSPFTRECWYLIFVDSKVFNACWTVRYEFNATLSINVLSSTLSSSPYCSSFRTRYDSITGLLTWEIPPNVHSPPRFSKFFEKKRNKIIERMYSQRNERLLSDLTSQSVSSDVMNEPGRRQGHGGRKGRCVSRST